jgi:hypothetical protein
MAVLRKCKVLPAGAGLLTAVFLFSVPFASASAAGFFESLFGGFGRVFNHRVEPPVPAYIDPFNNSMPSAAPRQERLTDNAAPRPRKIFCVRTCDGRFFPVNAHAGMSAAEACHSFCPACETRLYYGSSIDRAVARDGSRYTDLPNAFLYRKQLVANCSCTGRSVAGLAHVDARNDPTLRRGDVLATEAGLVVYNGGHHATADFTPVQSYSALSASERAKLLATKVTPRDRLAAETPLRPSTSPAVRTADKRAAQR